MLNRELTSAILRKTICFIGGFSVTANRAVLGKYEVEALKYLVEEEIIYLDKPDVPLKGATDNDKAGRYRLKEQNRAKAQALSIRCQHELNTNSRSN